MPHWWFCSSFIFASLTKMPGSWDHTLKVFHLLIWIIFILCYSLRYFNQDTVIRDRLKLAAHSLDFRVPIIEWVGSSAYSELRGDRRCKIRNASRCSCHPLLPTVSCGSMWDSCGSNLAGAGRLVGDWEELTFASELTQCPTQWSSEICSSSHPLGFQQPPCALWAWHTIENWTCSWGFPSSSTCKEHIWRFNRLWRVWGQAGGAGGPCQAWPEESGT